MSDLFTQQSTMPELFKTGEDIAEELKAQTVEPNTATDLLLNGDSKPNRFSRQCAENEEPDADLTENLLHDEKSNKNTITGTNTPRSSRASAYYDLLRSQHKNGHYRFCELLVPFELCNIGKPLYIRSWRMKITTEYILCHILRIGCIIRTVLGKFTFNRLTAIRFR